MRLGGHIFEDELNPETWIRALKKRRYRAAYCPVSLDADADTVAAYREAAEANDIVIAEVGAWSSPISQNAKLRREGMAKCTAALDLADRIGARCCVNTAGSRSKTLWAGPDPRDLSGETFDMIVEVTRKIIDEVKPRRTFFTLETMPWVHPDSVETYERLLRAINRRRFAVHLDPVNLVNTPGRFYHHRDLVRHCVDRLGRWVKSVHLKDIRMSNDLLVHIDECPPGQGAMDHVAVLRELDRLPDDTPVMLEHMITDAEYTAAAGHVRRAARKAGVGL